MELLQNGFVYLVPVLLPNLIWLFFSNHDEIGEVKESQKTIYKNLSILENVGRIGIFIIPLFGNVLIDQYYPYFAIMLFIGLFIYYAGWIRYFINERKPEYLYCSLWNLPYPLAVAPVFYFMLLSLLILSIPMLLFSIVFGIAHVLKSRIDYNLLLDQKE